MQARMAGQRTFEKQHKDQQLLTLDEEKTIVESIKRLHSWGWPYRVSQVRFLALKILQQRMLVVPEIGANWVHRFVKCHANLKSQFSTPKDKDQIYAQDSEVIKQWYQLFSEQVDKQKIKKDRDTYNMNEKRYAMGLIGKV